MSDTKKRAKAPNQKNNIDNQTNDIIPKDDDEAKNSEITEIDLEQEKEQKPDIPKIISIMPMRDSVIYPMLIAPLNVARPSSVQLIDESITTNSRIIGVIAQHKPQIEEPGFNEIYEVGCAVIIRTLVKMPDMVRLIVQGVSRFRIIEKIQEKPYLKARIELIDEPAFNTADEVSDEEIEALRRSIASLFEQAVRLSPQLPEELYTLTQAVQEPNVMADLVAAHLSLTIDQKQQILEATSLKQRLQYLLDALSHEVRVLELTSKVHSDVSAELSKSQREYYLREQLKAIQKELGEIDERGEDLEELKTKIEEAKMTPEALKEVNREYDRLKRMNPGAPEYTVARTYVDWMIGLPWSKSSQDNLDLKNVKKVLDDEHYGLEKIKERITEFLAVRKIKTEGTVRQPILCFVGPPGVGKTSLGRSISHAIERKFVRLSVGGMRDEAEIRGHRRTYIGALPGQIIQGIRRAETNNPVFMLDEVDKLGNDFRGDPSSALLEVLDPEQNNSFRDHYLDTPFDLSKVFFITTANILDTIPAPLRDRMEIIEIGSYTEEEKREIVKRHLINKQMEEHGLKESMFEFEDQAISILIRNYTREAGVRKLEQRIAAICRKATLKFAEGRRAKVIVNEKFIQETLGAPRFMNDEVDERKLVPGMAIGLAWTSVGGEVLFIEANKMSGSKNIIISGQLGDVMKESVTAALSYIRTNAKTLKIPEDFYEKSELHLHVPQGAVPKDGPSAGITMLTALASLITNKVIKKHLAMTGEITIKGEVLPVGGIKEKVLAAYRAGIKTLILPERNTKDYKEDVPDNVRKMLKVHFVKNADEVIALAFDKSINKTASKI